MTRLRYSASSALLLLGSLLPSARAEYVDPAILDACPGYDATNIEIVDGNQMKAELILAGEPCNVFGGEDLERLALSVVYETDTRIHVKISDASSERYEIPEDVLPIPSADNALAFDAAENQAQIKFNYTESPFTFTIYRPASGDSEDEVLLTTSGHPLIFADRYLRLKATLPSYDANIYGLGEHTNTFKLPTQNFTRTLWSRDSYGIPPNTNLYGNHPVWIEHRQTGTHGVFLRNSNGMDVKIDSEEEAGITTLEYNILGGVFDFYFLAGSTTEPAAVAKQYAEVVGLPAEVPYWSFGLHQCRFNYQNYIDVAGVISNYSAAGIPLETMWTDIDYMYERRVFTLDPEYFPIDRMREIVDYLHEHNQHYIVMVDPAVYYAPEGGYPAYDRGVEMDVWLKEANGSDHLGVVWPGVTVYPDWFHPRIEEYWNEEFKIFFSPEEGLDIDGVWIDMNEPASFCAYPCDNPQQQAEEQFMPPQRAYDPPPPDAPILGGSNVTETRRSLFKRQEGSEDSQEYQIDNAAGVLSDRTAHVDTVHANSLTEYDTHNLYGTMMSDYTERAMAARRPGKRTFIITRSTFAGAGRYAGKWLGDNLSNWEQYRFSIAGNLGFASIFQMPMVGSDICGFGFNTTETLCARWATLGAFSPFMRNHNGDTSISQEFYRWELVTEAAKYAIDIRYRLLDYMYTAFHQAKLDGTPVLHPLFYLYPNDTATYPIDLQFFYGPSILVSPVTQENTTSVDAYFPDDIFYDFTTLAPFEGQGANITFDDVAYDQIPLHIRGGAILPLRIESAMTLHDLREKNFELVIAPDRNGAASGSLYFDDGESLEQEATTELTFTYSNGVLEIQGDVGLPLGVQLERVRFAGVAQRPESLTDGGEYDEENQVLTMNVGEDFSNGLRVEIQ